MRSIIAIIQAHGGLGALKEQPIRIEPPGLMRLEISYKGKGPTGESLVAIGHYDDLACDLEVLVEVPAWLPVSFRQDSSNYHLVAVEAEGERATIHLKNRLIIEGFLKLWNRNLRDQGYLEVFLKQKGD